MAKKEKRKKKKERDRSQRAWKKRVDNSIDLETIRHDNKYLVWLNPLQGVERPSH